MNNLNDRSLLSKRDFTRFALMLALPIMVQNLVGTLVNTADTIMLGFVSQEAMSASSLANQFYFILECFYYGMSTGTSVLVAQYWGKKDSTTIERVIGLGIRVSVLISAAFSVVGICFPEVIMLYFTDDMAVVEEGVEYLRIMSAGFVFNGFSTVYLCSQRSMEKAVFPMATSLVSLAVNIIMNATFIFGLFGAPVLGVTGVALGTVIARGTETLMCIVHSSVSKGVKLRVKYLFAKSGVLFGDFLKVSIPAVLNDVIWALATSVYAKIMGHLSSDMVAANAVAVMVVNIGAIACRGFANATTIVVSKTIGENNESAVRVYSKRMLILTILVSALGGVVIVLLKPVICGFYSDKLTEEALSMLGSMLIMTTWRLVGEGINTCLICGCFRGGGDSRFGMITDTVFMWCVSIPVMAGAAYLLKLPPIWVYFAMTLDEYEKMPVVFAHYFKFGWIRNITRDKSELA